LMAVSWYFRGVDGVEGRGPLKGVRLSLVDWDADYPNTYRKILLVEPTGTAAAPSFKDVPVHAGGVVWYGDHLYVADTGHGMRVFDMRKILKTNTGGTADQIGRQSNGVYYAHNYAYVLPQIGTIASHTTSGTNLVWSTVSLDRVSKSIVMTEYTCPSGCASYPNRAPRAIRFPFASNGTFAANTTASQALQLPWYKLNGVASHNGRWWFNSSGDKRLYYWASATGSASYAFVSSGESMSYWEDATNADLLWTLQEGVGNRNVFAVTQATYDG
jgi:WD40 repeat protein